LLWLPILILFFSQYLEERNQFIRERANNSYSVAAYLISHFLFELPFVFLITVVCSSTVYWLVGLFPDPNRFFIFVANLYISLLVAESYMVIISAVIPYFIVGIAVGAFINGGEIVFFSFFNSHAFAAFMCVMGFFIAFSQIGWWWKWMRYIAVHYFSFSTVRFSIFCPIFSNISFSFKSVHDEPIRGQQLHGLLSQRDSVSLLHDRRFGRFDCALLRARKSHLGQLCRPNRHDYHSASRGGLLFALSRPRKEVKDSKSKNRNLTIAPVWGAQTRRAQRI
jgi:hypothetical protein